VDWHLIFTWAFLISLITAGIRLAVPVLLAVLGEIITERSGVLNLGLEGIMLVGGVAGFMTAWAIENGPLAASVGSAGTWIGLVAGMVAGGVMGLVMALLTVTLHADQVISSVTLVLLGQGISSYFYRQRFSSLTARVAGLDSLPIRPLSDIPVLGEMFFSHNPAIYIGIALVAVCAIFLNKTTWGLSIRAVGENPAAADTSGINVARVRYAAVCAGAMLTGLGGAILTVVQLRLFREGITAGRGWIAVALVIFARWRPSLALLGALLFGVADALQYRLQALEVTGIPYEWLLMLPYVLTLLVLTRKTRRSERPEVLGEPYVKDSV